MFFSPEVLRQLSGIRECQKEARSDEAFPPGFRVLCFSCNYATWLCGGECPHKDEKALELTSLKGMKLEELSDDLIPTPSFKKKKPLEQDDDDDVDLEDEPEDQHQGG